MTDFKAMHSLRAGTVLGLMACLGLACAGKQEAPIKEPNQLIGTVWQVEDINGRGVVDDAQTTLQFVAIDRVAGNGACNRYSGGAKFTGAGLKFEPQAGTRMMCADALMNQEQMFHVALGKVAAWEVTETGQLLLKDASGAALVRAVKQEL